MHMPGSAHRLSLCAPFPCPLPPHSPHITPFPQPEDYWSPAIEVPPGYAYEDEYGPISPMPNHDGTGEGGGVDTRV